MTFTARFYQGDCLDVMRMMAESSIDSIVCDPPYGMSFMNKNWDHGVPGKGFWEAALRVAKPGAMLLAFGGTRTHHRLMVAIEDAGWEIRDCLMWLYGSGFPKSHDIGKAIDKAAGAEREVIGRNPYYCEGRIADPGEFRQGGKNGSPHITAPATDAAKQWDGWGTALKPAWEPIILAMKPLDGTFANNALKWGVAGLNVDACRIGANGEYLGRPVGQPQNAYEWSRHPNPMLGQVTSEPQGRWPANLLLDEEAAASLDEMSGPCKTGGPGITKYNANSPVYSGPASSQDRLTVGYNDTGGASRFFYVAKASKADRDEGLEGMELRGSIEFSQGKAGKCSVHDVSNLSGSNTYACGCAIEYSGEKTRTFRRNFHPTVKPTQLMRYLVRLVTPPNGTILDPFMGSGSTGKAAKLEGFNFTGIELNAEYLEIAQRRIDAAQPEQTQLPLLEAAG